MKKINGYCGKILRVDLTSGTTSIETPDEGMIRKYLGGAGFGMRYLYDEVPESVGCFDPENRLIFATGPLGGTVIPGSGTYSVSTKGVLTNGGAAFSQANGLWGAFLKLAGYDGIIVQGAADSLVYLYMDDKEVSIRDAQHLAGLDTWELDDKLKKDLGFKKGGLSVAGIGPAGEHLVKFASIVSDKGHVAGHNGIGAVMGSKNLKAIAIARCKTTLNLEDPKKVSAIAKNIRETVKTNPLTKRLYEYGTLGTYGMVEMLGALPIKNYTTNIYPDKDKLPQFTPEYIRGRFEPKRNPCWSCQMHHCHDSTITEGPYKGMEVEEPEFECLSAMGSQIGNMEVASAMMLTNVVDRLGLEMNETGWVVGLAMECYEKGLISTDDADGLKLDWGNVEAAKSFLHNISVRKGLGDTFAEGAKGASTIIGKGAESMAVYTMKGNTPRGYDHRGYGTEWFDKITSNTGTLESRPTKRAIAGDIPSSDVVDIAASGKGRMSFIDTLGVCFFSTMVGMDTLADAVRAATGREFTADDAQNTGLRVINLARVYNFKAGHTRELEAPSPRYGSVPTDGPFAGKSLTPKLDEMLDDYYEQMGWDKETGKPLPETLTKLGLEDVIADIW